MINRPTLLGCLSAMVSSCLVLSLETHVFSADEPSFSAEDIKLYETKIKPILDDKCLKCHGGEKTKADLRVTSRGALLRGGESGLAINLDKPDGSLLLKMINYTDDDHQMPPKQKLPAEEIALITQWLKKGIPWTPGVVDEHAEVKKKPLINDETRNYWAYKKPLKSAPPKVSNAGWGTNPIDAYILADLDANGLKPAPPATPEVLIRRVYYDLLGLPPTAAEVAEFAANKDPKAYEKLIDRLLASPHYGEKWGRHWLDVVGYAETNGYERDGNKPNIWRYRDYVVKAFNTDKPYDQFVKEQLAGDELPNKNADSITATGYYRLGVWDDEPADRELEKYNGLDAIVSTTSGAFLGMALGCARCHDHKRDPLPQDDYYRLLGFFHNLKPMARDGGDIETTVTTSNEDKIVWEQRVAQLESEISGIEKSFTAKLPSPERISANTGSGFSNLSFRQFKGNYDKLPAFDKLEVERKGIIADGIIDLAIAGRDEGFALVFEGELNVPASGAYTFRMDSDDGARLSINDKKVLERDGVRGLSEYQDATVMMKAGKAKVRVDYFQGNGGKGLKLLWSGASIGTLRLSKEAEVEPGSSQGLVAQIEHRGTELLDAKTVIQYRSARRELMQLQKNAAGSYRTISVTENDRVNDTFVLARGNPSSKTKKVEPGFPQVLGFAEPKLPKGPQGRRTLLADWIINPDNPLTARVMANRVWQHHFGRGIVSTSSDFGKLGEMPTNQPLLDYLALEFQSRKWSIKSMHRLIMSSNTYRMSSKDDPSALAKDAGNLHQWRFNMRRLTAEEIRDSILSVDGSLNLAIGGPSIFAPVPKAVLATSSKPNEVWGKSSPDEEVRRSIYIKVKRSLVHPLLSMHDFADTDSSCPVRFATTVPTQALSMLNSEFINQRAEAFARRLINEEPKSVDKQVALGLRLVTQREPKSAEIQRATTFIKDLQASEKLEPEKALALFCLMALNLNEFVFLD